MSSSKEIRHQWRARDPNDCPHTLADSRGPYHAALQLIHHGQERTEDIPADPRVRLMEDRPFRVRFERHLGHYGGFVALGCMLILRRPYFLRRLTMDLSSKLN
jgi:hypothetical protein